MTRTATLAHLVDPVSGRSVARGPANDNAQRIFRALRNTLPFPVKCALTGVVVPAKNGFAVIFSDGERAQWRVVSEDALLANVGLAP